MIAESSLPVSTRDDLWLKSPTWDLFFISCSAALVGLPFAAYYAAQFFGFNADQSRNIANAIVALFIGGPHMYSTFTRTAFDPGFRRQYPVLLATSVLLPVCVIYFGIHYFIFLLTFFFFWASIHVLHQIVYLVDCYTMKQSSRVDWKNRFIDYAVVLTSLYPIAIYKLVHEEFHIGAHSLYFPDFLKHDALVIFFTAAFAISLFLFISKTVKEFRSGVGHTPKTIFISLTVVIAFFLPAFHELDVAFQGFNTWHSFQYLALTWYINRLRRDRGEIRSRVITKLSGQWLSFYGVMIGLTISSVGIIAFLFYTRGFTGLTFDQCYYIVVLSFLLTHYYHDHLLFTKPEAVRAATA